MARKPPTVPEWVRIAICVSAAVSVVTIAIVGNANTAVARAVASVAMVTAALAFNKDHGKD